MTPPPLVDPSARLLDLDRVIADLQKYKPFLSPQAGQAWEDFAENSKNLGEVSGDAFWEMPALVLAHKYSPNAAVESVSEATTTLIEKETRVPKGV